MAILFLLPKVSHAQDDATFDALNIGKKPQLFFDARQTGVSRDGQRQMFSGNVVAIGSGILITADKVEVDRRKNIMFCEGKVIVLTTNQVFIGDKIEYMMNSGNFRFTNATMLSDDSVEANKLAERILGFTTKELAFEERRLEQIKKVSSFKEDLRLEFRNNSEQQPTPSDDLVYRYARLLEREELIKGQENPVLAKMAERRREIFKNRRKYWKSKSATQLKKKRKKTFFRIEGKQLERIDDTVFKAQEAIWSPCNCNEDENPSWGFRADKVEARTEGYVDLYHPVLEIRGVPILYLPYLKLPMKSQRQSGFLMPRFADDRESGTIFSQPVYFLIDKKSDATVTTEVYENRGTKLGLELRYQAKKYSGWQVEFERVRDRLWLDARSVRKDVIDACRTLEASEAGVCDEARESQMLDQLESPENTWRGRQSWSGLQILAPRLSFTSRGSILSDHRYIEDLTLPDEYKDAFEIGYNATYFSTAGARLHLDGKDFYAGVGPELGDNVKTDDSFDGYQIPAKISLQSRMFNLIPENSLGIRAYGQVSGKHIQVMDFTEDEDGEIQPNDRLGSGSWQKFTFDYLSPLITDSIITVNQFADFEYRRIAHAGLIEPESSIHSWRTGLTFNLPIDGESELPPWMQDSDLKGDKRHLQHIMNWQVKLSVRPVVDRDGLYYLNKEPKYTYFFSDRDKYDSQLADASAEEDMMKIHRRVSLSTNHRWRSFLRGWQTLEAKESPTSEDSQQESYLQKARRELLYALDRPVIGAEDMFGEVADDYVWYVNRYRLEDYGRSEHVRFGASIAYDFEKADLRAEEEREGVEENDLTQPWSELDTNLTVFVSGLSLNNKNKYNIYSEKFSNMTFNLRLPILYGVASTFGYTIAQDPVGDDYVETQDRSVGISTKLFGRIGVSVNLARREKSLDDFKEQYQSIFRISYVSFEDCWKVDFGRTKEFDDDEREAKYLMQLSVLFLGESRRVGNLGNQVKRYINDDEET